MRKMIKRPRENFPPPKVILIEHGWQQSHRVAPSRRKGRVRLCGVSIVHNHVVCVIVNILSATIVYIVYDFPSSMLTLQTHASHWLCILNIYIYIYIYIHIHSHAHKHTHTNIHTLTHRSRNTWNSVGEHASTSFAQEWIFKVIYRLETTAFVVTTNWNWLELSSYSIETKKL